MATEAESILYIKGEVQKKGKAAVEKPLRAEKSQFFWFALPFLFVISLLHILMLSLYVRYKDSQAALRLLSDKSLRDSFDQISMSNHIALCSLSMTIGV